MRSRALKGRSLFPSHLESITGTTWKVLEHNGWSTKPGLKAKSGPWLVFINKVLLILQRKFAGRGVKLSSHDFPSRKPSAVTWGYY